MRIDTNSWHYKMNHGNYTEVAKSLCPYFWSTVLSVLVLSWLGYLISLIENQHWSAPEINTGVFKFLEKHSEYLRASLSVGLAGYGAIAYFIFGQGGGLMPLGMGIGLLIFQKYAGKLFRATVKTTYKIPEKNKEPSIMKEFVKAKHKSVCPMLEFVDVKKEDFNKHVKKIDQLPPFKFMTNCNVCGLDHSPFPLHWPDNVTKIHMKKNKLTLREDL